MPPRRGRIPKDLTLAEFRQFRDYIHTHSGIYLEESKRDSLRISLVTRAARTYKDDWDTYFELLAHDEAEFRELMNLITINETSFFRFPGQFDALVGRVLPEITASRTGDNRLIRIWSAGCSTGEEPYTIAMAWADSGLDARGWRAEVLGTDVSTKALGVAKAGLYPVRSLLNVPDDVVKRHFVEVGRSYRIAQHVRRLVDFQYHNLVKEPYPLALMGNWDVIFCRNVTIYFRLESTKRVVANLFNSLSEGGYLFIGHSETLSAITDDFELVESDGVFLYRKPHRTRQLHVVHAPEPVRGAQPATAPAPSHEQRRTAAAAEREETRRQRNRTLRPAPEPPTEAPRPGPQPDPLDTARALVAEGRQDEALQVVETVLSTQRNNAEAYLVSAHVHADKGDYDRAVAECQRALAIDPLLPGARYTLGLIHQRQGDLVRAVSELKKTIYVDADFALAHLALGNIYKADGRYHEACRSYENALRSLTRTPEGDWTQYVGGWKADVILKTCERSLLECRKVTGTAP